MAAGGRRPASKGATPRRGATSRGSRSAASGKGKGKGRSASPGSHRGRRVVAGLVVSAVLAVFLLVGVFPTRTWLDQRDETSARQSELERIRAEEQAYEERIDELEQPDAVEEIARRDHGMVKPGEQAFQIAPPAVAPVELPETWPFTGASDWLNR